jgi:hypothetical protein
LLACVLSFFLSFFLSVVFWERLMNTNKIIRIFLFHK